VSVTIYALKPRFQAFLRPLATALARSGVTANQVTVATCIVSVALGALVALQLPDTRAFLWIPIWMFMRMAFNALDGMLAREFGQQSRLGAYLNELTDVVADVALIAPFALLPPFAASWTVVVMVLATLSEYAGALGPLIGASRRYDGPLGKSDRALVFGMLGLWVGFSSPLPAWAAWIMPILAAALVATIVNRVRGGLRER
jgi:CDP-diacylglycerol---glycerol-3-phosphate 3-phosphatidyltransferase